jgi:HAD superfamily hydrolase (TIGR01662 family)
MNKDIEVIFLDVGNTLRVLFKDEPYQAEARKKIADFVGTDQTPEDFCKMLDVRYKIYRKWAFETLLEASEYDLWTRWLLPEWPAEKLGPLAGELTFLYRQTMGHRHAQPDTRAVLEELTKRGYKIGIISNTITEREIPNWLVEDGLDHYFSTVILSSIFGHRKPGTKIYHEAARQAGVDPSKCVYVGDNLSRDVIGTRNAGFGGIIIMLDPTDEIIPITDDIRPDLMIDKLSDLLDHFPARH